MHKGGKTAGDRGRHGAAELVADEARLDRMLEIASVGIMFFDLDGAVTEANDAFLKMLDFTREELEAGHIRCEDMLPAENRAQGEQVFRELREKGESTPIEMEHSRKDGERIWLHCAARRLSENAAVAFMNDVSARRQAEAHRDLLLNELNHRVKNTLATVQSIATQTFGVSSTNAELVWNFESRLMALAEAHNLLARRNWHGVCLRALLEQSVAAFAEGDRITFDGENPHLHPRAALALAMAFHELAANALRYGALARPEGRIDIEAGVAAHDGHRLQLLWRETGGPEVAEPEQRGFGSRLVESGLAYELGGEAKLDFRPEGLVWTLNIPLTTEENRLAG